MFSKSGSHKDSSILVSSRVNTKTVNNTLNFYFTHSFNDNRQLSFDLNYLALKTSADQFSQSNTYLPGNIENGKYILLSNTPFDAKIYGVKTDYSQKIASVLKFETGLQFVYLLRNSSGSYLNQKDNNMPSVNIIPVEYPGRGSRITEPLVAKLLRQDS